MSANVCPIYLLPLYANHVNLKPVKHETEYEYKVEYSEGTFKLRLSERTSLIEDRYCLSMHSAKYEIDSRNEIRETMIHHHPGGGHLWKHLQFKLAANNEVIRINLEPLGEEDYTKCIKGFLHICQDLINQEKEEQNIDVNLINHFFNESINELLPFRTYLLGKIKAAYVGRNMLNNLNQPIDGAGLENLRLERHLLPFLNWE